MEEPPESAESVVSMRFAFGATDKTRSPKERLAIRDALRIRGFVGDLWRELGKNLQELPMASTDQDPESVANQIRETFFEISLTEQMSWSSVSQAFNHWRKSIERIDILVFLYSLGEDSARGFSFASESPPVISVSTTWHPSVRIYTLFHELGHILTRTNSSCYEANSASPTKDPVERWCESFSAAFLMPRQEFQELSESRQFSSPISAATWLSNKLHVSRKSALLRLVEIGSARWQDFQKLESRFEKKSRGGHPDPNNIRTRDVTKRHTYGSCLSSVYEAYETGLINEADIRTYFRIYPEELK